MFKKKALLSDVDELRSEIASLKREARDREAFQQAHQHYLEDRLQAAIDSEQADRQTDTAALSARIEDTFWNRLKARVYSGLTSLPRFSAKE